MQNAACCEFNASWKQRIVAGICTDLPLKATLPHWNNVREKTVQVLMLGNNVYSSVARRNVTDVATIVFARQPDSF